MEATTLFAKMPPTPEPIIARVRRALSADCRAGQCPPAAELDRLADAAVRELWQSRIKLFVPVLALRHALQALRATRLALPPEPAAPVRAVVPTPRPPARDREDVLLLDERDVLTLSDGPAA